MFGTILLFTWLDGGNRENVIKDGLLAAIFAPGSRRSTAWRTAFNCFTYISIYFAIMKSLKLVSFC